MARYTCQRCGVVEFTTNPPHLCRDLRKRLERNTEAIAIVRAVLEQHEGAMVTQDLMDEVAPDVVKALAGRDLGV